MNNRTLGIIAIICAPFLLINTIHDNFRLDAHSSYSGLFGFIYMTGWMCSLVALRRMNAFGKEKFGKVLFLIQMLFLSLAQLWNLYEFFQPGASTKLYFLLDMFWPGSNLCMFVTGITISIKGRIKGWMRYTPLMTGCWLPLGLICWSIFSRTPGMLLFINIYSALTWCLMGLAIVMLAGKSDSDKAGIRLSNRLREQYS